MQGFDVRCGFPCERPFVSDLRDHGRLRNGVEGPAGPYSPCCRDTLLRVDMDAACLALLIRLVCGFPCEGVSELRDTGYLRYGVEGPYSPCCRYTLLLQV